MLNLFEIKRRSRVEYVMYEKNECFINQYEFNHKKQKDLVCDWIYTLNEYYLFFKNGL